MDLKMNKEIDLESLQEWIVDIQKWSDSLEMFVRNAWLQNPDELEQRMLEKQDRIVKLKIGMNRVFGQQTIRYLVQKEVGEEDIGN